MAITPVINAIRVLERFVPDGELLFDAAIHDPAHAHPHARHRTGSLGNHAIAVRVEDFVAWGNNEATKLGLPDEVIAPDPHGRLGATRFKRTSAWHIARRPCRLPAAGRFDEVAPWSGPRCAWSDSG
ncbi:hypothetical protein ACFWAF_25630 [Streptomyces microflavus]|uniref:hypothetical protein n=1 Tax=Streptomyces microflavus TaxID=1919 RepID=UPI00366687CF